MERKKSFFTRFFFPLKPQAKKWLLFFAGVAAIAIFFVLPPYKEWLHEKIMDYYKDFAWQKKSMGVEQRMVDRFQGDYTYSKQIAAIFEKKRNKKTVLVMIPPTDYFKENDVDYHVPEPIVFYYYTGLKTLWPNSSNAATANWYIHVINGKIVADSVTNKQAFADTLKAFNKFDISL